MLKCMAYLPTFDQFYGFHVGKYTSPIEHLGMSFGSLIFWDPVT